MQPLVRCLLFLVLLGTGWAPGASAQTAAAPDDSVAVADTEVKPGDSWLTRTLKRYFGNTRQIGDDLDGKAVELVDRYAAHIGKTIEVVIVHQVARFDPYWDADQGSSQQFLNSVTKPFHSYTKDRLIREYLLFEKGQPLDPFLLADSERMLRQLDFINDVRIILVPLMGKNDDSVVVIIETRDRWPFGIAGRIKEVNRYNVNLFFSNIGGYGIRLDNQLLYNGDLEPNLGYQGRLSKRNIKGSFIDGEALYEDSWRKLTRLATVQRTLVHPGIRWVGGGRWEYTDVRDNGGIPLKFQEGDYWLGRSIPLIKARSTEQSARPMLIPAVRFRKIDYLESPLASPDSNASYLDTKDYLVGVTYQRIKNFITSYLFKMGETEDVPAGFTAKITGGYQAREGYDRTSGFLQVAYSSVRPQGSITVVGADLGGYFHNHVVEDGSFSLVGSHYTRLKGQGRFRHRLYGSVVYSLAFNRRGEGALDLGEEEGLPGLENQKVLGNQRLLMNLESRVFTPWSLWGFRFMVFGYAAGGGVGDEEDPIFQQKLYSTLGLGFRFYNPDLVLPATQVRFGFVNSVEGSGFVTAFRIGGVDDRAVSLPGVVPGGFAFK